MTDSLAHGRAFEALGPLVVAPVEPRHVVKIWTGTGAELVAVQRRVEWPDESIRAGRRLRDERFRRGLDEERAANLLGIRPHELALVEGGAMSTDIDEAIRMLAARGDA